MLSENIETVSKTLVEINNTLRAKLAKASTLIKEKNAVIVELKETMVPKTRLDDALSKFEIEKEKLERLTIDNCVLVEEIDFLKNGKRSDTSENYKKTLKSLQLQLKLAAMHIDGLEAELDAFKNNHTDSVLLVKNDTKTKSRAIYEEAFDSRGASLGVLNPSALRT